MRKTFIPIVLVVVMISSTLWAKEPQSTLSIFKDIHFKKERCLSNQCVQIFLARNDVTFRIDDSHLYDLGSPFIYPKISVYETKNVFILVQTKMKSNLFGYPQFMQFLTQIAVKLKEATLNYRTLQSQNLQADGTLGGYEPDFLYLQQQVDKEFLQTTGKYKGKYCFSISFGPMYQVPDGSGEYYTVEKC